ncbi:MAG: UDP-N-acetylglucosamine 2-epimerase (non-hydrolyzing) [bacterium]
MAAKSAISRKEGIKMRLWKDSYPRMPDIRPGRISLYGVKYAIVLGTRPEIIKMAPIIKELKQRGIQHIVIHSGQHYSPIMDSDIFKDLNLRQPDYNLKVGSDSREKQIERIRKSLIRVLRHEEPDIVLVQGDTNTVLAGAYAAVDLGIEVGHIEAGLRSYDRRMPEEINRILTDSVSNYLFAPTCQSKENLLREGFKEENIYVTGNTIVDAILQNLSMVSRNSHIAAKLRRRLNTPEYVLLTLHRPSNVDSRAQLSRILREIVKIPVKYGLEIIFPMHPRTRKMISKYQLWKMIARTQGILATKAIDFLDCLELESKERLVMTDSGGLQEESCILRVPCITLRENTERPETLEIGSNILMGKRYDRLLDYVAESLKKGNDWKNPYGDGKAAKRIVKIVQNNWHRGDNSERVGKALFALPMSSEKSLLSAEPQRISSFFKTRT